MTQLTIADRLYLTLKHHPVAAFQTNGHFAAIFKCDPRSIPKALTVLKNKGLVVVHFNAETGARAIEVTK